TPSQRQLLGEGIAVWENALATEISAANSAGERAGHERGVTFFAMPPQDQARFDEIYERDGARRAKSLERYGIDGLSTFRRARAIARDASAAGTVECNRGHDGSTS